MSPTRSLKRKISELLSRASDSPDFEAEVVLEEIFGRDYRARELRGELISVSPEQEARAMSAVNRRLSGEPLQYIVGEWEFYGLRLRVAPGVLIPRQDTETLVDTALDLIKYISCPRVVDLCSGTGCVALAIKSRRPDSEVTAVEKYPAAFEILKENIKIHPGVTAVSADVLDPGTAEGFRGIDLITANPPYLTAADMKSLQREVAREPKEALFGGGDGLDFYRKIPKIWRGSLKAGGHIAFEIGLGQEDAVGGLLESAGYRDIRAATDLTGRARVVVGA